MSKAFVQRKVSETDKRIVYLIATDAAIELFGKLSKTFYDLKVSAPR